MRALKTAIFSLAALTAGAGFSSALAATVQIADYEVDSSLAASGMNTLSGRTEIVDKGGTGVTDKDVAVVGELSDGIRCVGTTGCSFRIQFFDHEIENHDGDDLLIAGLGTADNEIFSVRINGVTLSDLTLINTGLKAGAAWLKTLTLDLSDFGVDIGASIREIAIIVAAGANPEEFSYFTAIEEDVIVNPIPAAAWLFGTALLGGGYMSRKKRKPAQGNV